MYNQKEVTLFLSEGDHFLPLKMKGNVPFDSMNGEMCWLDDVPRKKYSLEPVEV